MNSKETFVSDMSQGRGNYSASGSRKLDRLLKPRTVALVGATERSMWSVNIVQNLRQYSPQVSIHCISPTKKTVHGISAVPSFGDLSEQVDLAYVMSPRETVGGLLREAAHAGVKGAIVLTAGFGELADGQDLQRDLVQAVEETGICLLGPNASGFINIQDGVVPFGLALPSLPDCGPASFILQSGGLMKPVLGLARSWGIGVGLVTGSGNEASLSSTDLAGYLLEDERTGAIGMFVEGFRDPKGFRALAERALEFDRPLVVLSVGRSDVARRSALSHTGALAGDAAVTAAVLKQMGVVQVSSVEELVATTGLLSRKVRPRGGRTVVIAASGGACDLVADKADEVGITLPDLPSSTLEALQALLPGFAHIQNPLDVTGYATVDPKLPIHAARSVGQSLGKDFDLMLFQAFVSPPVTPANPEIAREHFKAIAAVAQELEIPVLLADEVAVGLGDFARELFSELELIRLPGIEIGLTSVGQAIGYVQRRTKILKNGSTEVPRPLKLAGIAETGTNAVSESQLLNWFAQHGVPVVPFQVVMSAAEAVRAARILGGKVVLKICSPDIPHKTDVGGVILDIVGDQAVSDAFTQLMDNIKTRAPTAVIEGVLIAPYRRGGTELILGLKRDPVWGGIVMLGLGGVLVEVLSDVRIRQLPICKDDVFEMLDELRGARILKGVRGRPAADMDALANAILAFSELVCHCDEDWDSFEINPLRVDGEQVEALDALMITTQGL